MALDSWYARQFGERRHFAVFLSLGTDPYPSGDKLRDATWGGISIWARGRCVTASVSSEGAFSHEIHWSLLDILDWLLRSGIRLVNEEPYPFPACSSRVYDGCQWINETEDPPARLAQDQEKKWFMARSEWRRHHALRAAAVDVALPNVFLRRLGDDVEISWDNETWGAARSDLQFVERLGTVRVCASQAAEVISNAVGDCLSALADKSQSLEFDSLAKKAKAMNVSDNDWRWLVHDDTAELICREMGDLRDRLNKSTRNGRSGLYVPHTTETWLLRRARVKSSDEIQTLLRAIQVDSATVLDPKLASLARRMPAPTSRPFRSGYDFALEVREALGWGEKPAPPLDEWMTKHGVALTRAKITRAVDLVTSQPDELHGSVTINLSPSTRIRSETAAASALGHLLMDHEPVSVDGAWEHWPTSARARAFGVMLLLPQDGVHRALADCDTIAAPQVKKVMDVFGTGPYATTHHLRNLGFIESDEEHDEILYELVSDAARPCCAEPR